MTEQQQDQEVSRCPVSQKASSGGGCPYKFNGSNDQASSWSNPMSWFSSSNTSNSSTNEAAVSSNVNKGSPDTPSIEEAAAHPQARIYSSQNIPLSTHRVVSSIPRSDSILEEEGMEIPKHQVDPMNNNKNGSFWMYPSEQQFYNAMTRKGWKPNAEEMEVVVAIHNAVNERGWHEVKKWEKDLHGIEKPRLIRFMGRPNDTSPKAWVNSNLLGYKPPFDRHDWFVERNGKAIRYVIDFYNGGSASSENNIPLSTSMYLDVRPALDSPGAFVDRFRMNIREMFPGVFDSPSSGKPNTEK